MSQRKWLIALGVFAVLVSIPLFLSSPVLGAPESQAPTPTSAMMHEGTPTASMMHEATPTAGAMMHEGTPSAPETMPVTGDVSMGWLIPVLVLGLGVALSGLAIRRLVR